MKLLDQKAILKTFLGLKNPENVTEDSKNNYWILIGERGQIIEENNDYFPNRVLVQFEINLDDLNLYNHNPIKNTLWILISDLEINL